MPIKGRNIPIPNVSVHGYLWKRCKDLGNRLALIDNSNDENRLTFSEIYQQSRNCAIFLSENGVGRGQVVGLCARSSPQFAVAMLGILGCGATVTPCNPAYNEGEIVRQFSSSEPKIVVVDESRLEIMKNVKSKLTCLKDVYVIGNSAEFTTLEKMCQRMDGDVCLETPLVNTEDDLAIMPYSSGTTGVPKSVMLTHKNLVAAVVAFVARHTEWTDQDALVAYMDRPMFHVGGYGYVLLCMGMGMTMVIERGFDIGHMLKTVEKFKVTHLMTVPPILIQLANADGAEKYDTSTLSTIIGGGAAMAPEVLLKVMEKFSVSVTPGYGMTEVSGISINHETKEYPLSAGRLHPNVEVKIVDLGTSDECIAEENGEICIRGAQVMKGYFKNPEETTNTIDNEGWLHTGDIGHVDKDGRLYVVDRLKEVIKYKGVQVPPAELENVILEHPKVSDVGVIGIPDPIDGEIPKAFVVRREDNLTENEIKDFVKSRLVDYKQLRGGVEFVDAIPKSITGKIQRNELKKMAGQISGSIS